MGDFIKRLLSALLLLPPVLFLIYKGGIYINLIVGLVVVLCSIEYYRMLGFEKLSLIISVCLSLAAYSGLVFSNENDAVFIIIPVFILAGLYVLFTIKDIKGSALRVSYLFTGIIYTGIFPAFIPFIRNHDSEKGFYNLLTFLAVIWLSDTFAYFIGKSLGRHKLYEIVSPKKTIEGSLGGIAGGIAGVYIIALFFGKCPSLPFVLLAGVVVNLAGQAGDLFESMFKRDAGIKDSGNLIPGHGGMLDRVDAIIFSAPVMYLILRFLL
ncbi:MAG: phosphatidate cytidylyltransferase [Deltaproteobacteria bacterium]|nr:phosphatidate cytidylyltransferase [Deltaproteobacteria bacterium]